MRDWKAGGFVLLVCLTVAASGQPGAKDGEWPTYGADLHNSRYRPLDQIHAGNFSGFNVGTLVTKTLVIAGEGQVTTTADHPRGAMLRAYDKATGKEVGAVWMPAPQTGSPMTYMAKGRQYIVVAVSGGPYSGEYLAFTLPAEEK